MESKDDRPTFDLGVSQLESQNPPKITEVPSSVPKVVVDVEKEAVPFVEDGRSIKEVRTSHNVIPDHEKYPKKRSKLRYDPKKLSEDRERKFAKVAGDSQGEHVDSDKHQQDGKGVGSDDGDHIQESEESVEQELEVFVNGFDPLNDDNDVPEQQNIEDFIQMNPATCRLDVKFQSCTNSTIRKYIKDVLTAEEFANFLESSFEIYMRATNYNHQGMLHRCIREFQVQAPDDEQLWIFVDGKVLKFTIIEFAILTGFRIDSREEDFIFPAQRRSTLMTRYFADCKTVKKGMLLEAFEARAFGFDHEDAVNMAILVFICSFILSLTGDNKIDIKFFHLVETKRYSSIHGGKYLLTHS